MHDERFRRSDVRGIVEGVGARECGIDRRRLVLECLQLRDAVLVGRDQLRAAGIGLGAERTIEHVDAIPLFGPPRRRLPEPRAPWLDVTGDDGRDFGNEVQELGGGRRRRRTTRPDQPTIRGSGGLSKLREQALHVGDPDHRVATAGRLVRDQAIQRALKLTNAADIDPAKRRDRSGSERDTALRAPGAEDRDARLVIGEADVHDQPGGQARGQLLVDIRDIGRRTVAGTDDLSAVALHFVAEPEELRLRLPPAAQELRVVDQEQAGVPKAMAKRRRVTHRHRGV